MASIGVRQLSRHRREMGALAALLALLAALATALLAGP